MKTLLIEIPAPPVTDCNIHIEIIPATQGYLVVIVYAAAEPPGIAANT